MEPKVSVIVPVYNVENYIENMLVSVQNQSLREFEVIVVNDGSTDGSQEIIESFCECDERFKSIVQKNAGVTGARTTGLSLARGEYVVFYDPDDFVPQKALEKMYKGASKRKADIAIGVMEEINLGERTIYMHSQKLAKQKYIEPWNQYFFGAWSLCNKMFSLKFIRDNNIEMVSIKHSEDGIFTFCALDKAKVICGVDVIAYNYIRRSFWLNASATQTISEDYLEAIILAHSKILGCIEILAAKFQIENKSAYMEEIYIRFIGDLINGYYRNNWRSNVDLSYRVKEKLEEYKGHITQESWNKILKQNRDIDLARGFKTPIEISDNPLLSVVISDKLTEKELNLTVGSIYNQMMPDFEVLVSEDARSKISAEYRDKINVKNVEEQDIKGKYVVFVEEHVIFTGKSFKAMVDKLNGNPNLDFVSVMMKNFDGKNYKDIKPMVASYGYTKVAKTKPGKLTSMDTFISNKMFRRKVLIDLKKERLTTADVISLYGSFKFEKIKKGVVLTSLNGENIISNVDEKPSELRLFLEYRKNKLIGTLAQKLKRVITREDIERLKKKFGGR